MGDSAARLKNITKLSFWLLGNSIPLKIMVSLLQHILVSAKCKRQNIIMIDVLCDISNLCFS